MMMMNKVDWSDKESVKEYRREYSRKYRREYPEKVRVSRANYRAKNREKMNEARHKYRRENPEKVRQCPSSTRTYRLKKDYNLSAADFLEMWEKQNGHCANPDCDIKLVDPIFLEEKTEYENDPNLTAGVDYARADVDHDHDYEEKHGKCKEMVRGLLCRSCNRSDVLDPDSKHYIHGPKVSDFTE